MHSANVSVAATHTHAHVHAATTEDDDILNVRIRSLVNRAHLRAQSSPIAGSAVKHLELYGSVLYGEYQMRLFRYRSEHSRAERLVHVTCFFESKAYSLRNSKHSWHEDHHRGRRRRRRRRRRHDSDYNSDYNSDYDSDYDDDVPLDDVPLGNLPLVFLHYADMDAVRCEPDEDAACLARRLAREMVTGARRLAAGETSVSMMSRVASSVFISADQFLFFCHDWNVCPTLCRRVEAARVYRYVTRECALADGHPVSRLSYAQFVHCLGRLAVLVFSKSQYKGEPHLHFTKDKVAHFVYKLRLKSKPYVLSHLAQLDQLQAFRSMHRVGQTTRRVLAKAAVQQALHANRNNNRNNNRNEDRTGRGHVHVEGKDINHAAGASRRATETSRGTSKRSVVVHGDDEDVADSDMVYWLKYRHDASSFAQSRIMAQNELSEQCSRLYTDIPTTALSESFIKATLNVRLNDGAELAPLWKLNLQPRATTRWIAYDGMFLDMGCVLLDIAHLHRYRIVIRNASHCTVLIDVSFAQLPFLVAEYHCGPLASGMSRTVFVSFNTDSDDIAHKLRQGEYLGNVAVRLVSKGDKRREPIRLRIPLYVRVRHHRSTTAPPHFVGQGDQHCVGSQDGRDDRDGRRLSGENDRPVYDNSQRRSSVKWRHKVDTGPDLPRRMIHEESTRVSGLPQRRLFRQSGGKSTQALAIHQ